MKKLGIALGGAVGFVLGSRSGRKPYESLEEKARQLAGRSRVRAAEEKVGDAAEAASLKAQEFGEKAKEKLASSAGDGDR